MSTTTIFRNNYHGTSGGSPPSLNGNAGSLVGVLDFCLVSGMGWTKVYSGTNKAVYRAPTGNRFYLRIDDTGSTTARVRVYESMTDVDTGVYPTPSENVLSGGAFFAKSTTADSTARPWFFASDGRFFHFFNQATSTTGTTYQFSFGDFRSLKRGGGDVYNTVLLAQQSSLPTGASMIFTLMTISSGVSAITFTGQYLIRPYTQIGQHVPCARASDMRFYPNSSTNIVGAGVLQFPAPIQGGLVASPIWIQEPIANSTSISDIRGVLPGEWCQAHNTAFVDGATFTGPVGSDLAGKTFEAFTMTSGQKLIETSNTWDSA